MLDPSVLLHVVVQLQESSKGMMLRVHAQGDARKLFDLLYNHVLSMKCLPRELIELVVGYT
jgi:hypothetical protein